MNSWFQFSPRSLAVAAVAMLAILAVVTIFALPSSTRTAQADHTGGSASFTADLLMLDTTLEDHGGTQTPVEVQQAALLPLTVDVVSATTWGNMTADDFSHYKAIVLGDPHCNVGTASIAAAEANRSVWGPVVTGNVVVIGTDPDFHRSQGGAALTNKGLAFAAAEPGKTGAYITLSCYYANVPTTSPVPVPLLDQFGSFTVHGQFVPGGTSCPADSHIVATHPALAGLTDADLSNWGCSFHEGFVLPLPSDFLVLAIAEDVPSTFVAADGTSGTPYIIARGVEVISDIDLAPDSAVNPVGTSHTVTATVTTDDPTAGTPVVGTIVDFVITAGPNSGQVSDPGECSGVGGNCITDAAGQVSWTYTDTAGIEDCDTIVARFTDAAGIVQSSNTVEKCWEPGPGVTEVPVDIKPTSCRNPLQTNGRGVLPAAILGTDDFDVTEVDVSTVQLEGVSPLRSSLRDVATPFEPFTGKVDAFDCTDEGPDGFLDLTLKFDKQAVLDTLGPVADGDVIVLHLTANLLDGTPIVGEDVVVIIDR